MEASHKRNDTARVGTGKDDGTSTYSHIKAGTILFDPVNVQAGYFLTTFSSNDFIDDEAKLNGFTILAGIDF